MYKRILIKLSGELLAGDFVAGIDPKVASYFAKEIKKASETGCQVVVVVGGGNMVRGVDVAGQGIKRTTADHMGMLSGLINAIALTDIFEDHDIPTRCLSNVFVDQVAESHSFRRAEKHLQQGRVVIIAGGTGRPFFTHDTAAINIALEMTCEVMLKATKVDGVYDKDPKKNGDAKKLDNVTYRQAVENDEIKVMDKAAIGMAMEQNMPVIIYEAMVPDNLLNIIQGKKVGTLVK